MSNGTVTDFDGNFHLQTHRPHAVLVFSYIGFETEEVSVQGRTYLEVILSEVGSIIEDPWWKKTIKLVGHDVVGAIAGFRGAKVSGAIGIGIFESASAAIDML